MLDVHLKYRSITGKCVKQGYLGGILNIQNFETGGGNN